MIKDVFSYLTVALFLIVSPAGAQEPQTADELNWVTGPSKESVGEHASIRVPAGVMFLDTASTQDFLRLTENLSEPGAVTLAANDLSWFAILAYDDTGHIADDEAIDADALLESMKTNQAAANEEKVRLGFGKLFIEGWSVPPNYNSQTRNLEWGLTFLDEPGNKNINFTTRTLGREGLVASTLVTSPETFDRDLANFRQTMAGLNFNPGQTYSEYREGDKTAAYGLAALVAGGAAAAAVKSGFGKGFALMIFAAIAAAFAAVVGFVKKLFVKSE